MNQVMVLFNHNGLKSLLIYFHYNNSLHPHFSFKNEQNGFLFI